MIDKQLHADDVRLSWSADEQGGLVGWLEVRNSGEQVLRVSGKPSLAPLGVDGSPLAAECLVTAEWRMPDYVDVPSGGLARASVGWAGWDGSPASGQVEVTISDTPCVVEVDGPPQPSSRGPATNLWSGWFELAS